MAWIEVHQSLPTHRKTLQAAERLGISLAQVVGHVVCLWLWGLDNTEDGRLTGVSGRIIAQAAQWNDDPEQFVEALVAVGFLDRQDDDYRIHDWEDYAGRLIDQRRANAERQRRFRERRNADITVTSPLRNGAPYLTVPNHTVPGSNYVGEADASPEREESPASKQDPAGVSRTVGGMNEAERRVRPVASSPRSQSGATDREPAGTSRIGDANEPVMGASNGGQQANTGRAGEGPDCGDQSRAVWAALVRALKLSTGAKFTPQARSRWNAAIKDLRAAGVTPDDIPHLVANYETRMGSPPPTPHALVVHLPELFTGYPRPDGRVAPTSGGRVRKEVSCADPGIQALRAKLGGSPV